ncbi:hypothetical protein PL8927_780067 [Planktothrix serta PCC 8927]|uniref:Uncharacterized protein n=1 Tax=Planktothrix serta PCC 8927 TaxID=671068 RepID=A0A7Z9C0K5_9CYAN|nr:hypothetical protein PL8927_780067 [Planktothrix serta PCC 8927]
MKSIKIIVEKHSDGYIAYPLTFRDEWEKVVSPSGLSFLG